MTLWLVGMMGSGKTTAGRLAAKSLGVRFCDTDEEIVSRHGRPVADLWGEIGERAFRDLEASVIRHLTGEEAVIATGGGVVLDEQNRTAMRETGPVVWLKTTPTVMASRLEGGFGRPLLDDSLDAASRLGAVLEERRDAYDDAAHFEIDTDSLTVEEVAGKIVALWPS